VPCLFAEQGRLPISRLLVALDGSERGMAVFTTARDFAEAVGASVGVVTVEEMDRAPSEEPGGVLPLTRSSRLWRELEPVRSSATAAAWAAEPPVAIRRGHVVREVMSELAESGADVLALGCHRGGPSGILEIGGTARHLVHTAPASVLAIPL
jgi:nucleotide-binding universal stress UspA family protein